MMNVGALHLEIDEDLNDQKNDKDSMKEIEGIAREVLQQGGKIVIEKRLTNAPSIAISEITTEGELEEFFSKYR